MNIMLNTFLYIVNMVLVMECPHKENVMKLTLKDYDNWWWKLLTAWCWTFEKLYSWWWQLVIWKKQNDIQKEWLSYEGCKEEEKVKKVKGAINVLEASRGTIFKPAELHALWIINIYIWSTVTTHSIWC
jgi:hypothetical protein